MSEKEVIEELKKKIIDIEKEALVKHMDFKNDKSYSNRSKINDATVKNIIKAVDSIGDEKDDNKED